MNKLARKFYQEYVKNNDLSEDEIGEYEYTKLDEVTATDLCHVAYSFEVMAARIDRELTNPWSELIKFSHENYSENATDCKAVDVLVLTDETTDEEIDQIFMSDEPEYPAHVREFGRLYGYYPPKSEWDGLKQPV